MTCSAFPRNKRPWAWALEGKVNLEIVGDWPIYYVASEICHGPCDIAFVCKPVR